ncbi:hypothetical protein ACJMK2_030750 [Sinanodonta woodiana]|uniref:Uncharacterized protein n=1 Tax=Sinanodonta woodiana TaxID=1069815 RepID=A0ABD3WWP4_SINWO
MEEIEFNKYLTNMFTSGYITLGIAIGWETGLLEFLCKTDQPLTAMEIADGAKLKERYVREWLGCMVAANVVILEVESGRYHVPANHKKVLLNQAVFASGLIHYARRFDMTKDVFTAAGPKGFSYATDPRLFDWMDSFRELEKDHIVANDVMPVLEELGMKQELESGIKVVDIGCASANISGAIAKLFTNSTFTGLEYTDSGVERAKENVRQKGISNMTIEQGDALNLPDSWTEQFDWVFVYDVIHDLPDPRKAFSEIRRILKNGGKFWVFETNAHSTHGDNVGNNDAAMFYTQSMLLCLPSSMLYPPYVGYGTCWGIEECEKALVESNLKVIKSKTANYGADHLFVCVK